MPTTRPIDRIALAAAIVANGKPYTATQPVEGDVESGPYALTYTGYRWGQLRLEKAPNGSWWITTQRVDADGYPAGALGWLSMPSPYRSGDFRLRRIARAVGFSIDGATLLQATRAERSAHGRRLTPDHGCETSPRYWARVERRRDARRAQVAR